ncbi:cs antigen [Moniliophthora roreri]|nr:cs antigen [Moniliophthora roreri]
MKFIAAIVFLATSVAALSFKRANVNDNDRDGQSLKLRYVTDYGNSEFSFNNVACSNGENGMLFKGYNKVQDVPSYVGGAYAVEGYNDDDCGSCWEIYYNDKSIRLVAVDTAQEGFNVPKDAMDRLTNGFASDFGVIDVTARKLQPGDCGLRS